MIPKIVHQVWYQGIDKLPEEYKANVQSLVEKNPNWQHIYWDDNSIQKVIKSLGQPYLDRYLSFDLMHQKIDFARYVILYMYGGVSVDTDVFALKGFDETPHINESDFIVSSNSIDSFVNNATILISKNHRLMIEFIDSIMSNNKEYKSDTLKIWNTTGPKAFTKFVYQHKGEITILPYNFLEPCSGMNKYCVVPPTAILDHRHVGSWVNPFYKNLTKSYYWYLEYKPLVLTIVIILIILFIIRKI